MGGRASLILVIGFAVIFGIINVNIAKLTSRSTENMIGYNESSLSRIVANSGANIGMSMFSSAGFVKKTSGTTTLINKDFSSGNFQGTGFTVNYKLISATATEPAYWLLRSVSRCTTFVKEDSVNYFVLSDTVEVRLDSVTQKSFSEMAWLTDQEGNVFFITGDTLWGQVHSNSNIHISGSPVFMGRTSTSGVFDPKKNSADFKIKPPETKVPDKEFPTNISELISYANNDASTRDQELWVELKPGTSNDDDGYAIISTVVPCTTTVTKTTYDKWGNPHTTTSDVVEPGRGIMLDSILLSESATGNVIYSDETIHVSGILDGNLSIASLKNLEIENDITYERRPNPYEDMSSTANQTKDMLGLVGYQNVIISDNIANAGNDLYLEAAVMAVTGSFKAENYNSRGVEGRLYLQGSVAQKERGAVGTFSGGSITNGYYKSYHYDRRLCPEKGDKNAAGDDYEAMHPPHFPFFSTPGPLAVKSWWESTRKPFNVDDFY